MLATPICRLVLAAVLAALLAGAAAAQPSPPPAAPKPKASLDLGRYTGDLDGMMKRRVIRALVVPTRTQYWIEAGVQTCIEYELLRAFEDEVNRTAGDTRGKHVRVYLAFVPVARDRLIPALLEGRGDIAAAGLTATPERLAQVDFAPPFFRGVREVAVGGPHAPKLATLDDLAGQEVYVRRSSSYWEHLAALSARLTREGKAAIKLRPAPEDLQDDDLLEMVNAGLLPFTVVDAYIARIWTQILQDTRAYLDLPVNTGGEIGWMIRKGSPKLRAAIEAFVQSHGQGTAFGNTVVRKYTGSTRFVKGATTEAELKKFTDTVNLFRKYGDTYKVDYLLMMAQGYQESRLDQATKSPVGAIGVMQVMPDTGRSLNVGDVTQLEPNIHAGVKYLRFMVDRYYANEPMTPVNKGLFAFASYNAGPARIAQLRREAEKRGLDPNVWFNNVELVAAEKIGRETVTYVSNIYKYYIAYTLVTEEEAGRAKARERLRPGG